MAEEKSDTHYISNYLTPCTWELSVLSTAFTVSQREVLYAAFTEAKRQTPCARPTTPLSPEETRSSRPPWALPVRDAAPCPTYGADIAHPAIAHPSHRKRHGTGHHCEDNTRSSYATDGERRLRVMNRLAQPQSRSGKKLTSSHISLLSCTKNLTGLGGQRGSLVDEVPKMDDSEQKEVKQ